YEALTRHNYFPNQKEGARELPPCFSTVSFTPEIAELLAKLDETSASGRRKLGYDQVSYAVTRHNNVPRTLALIHPKAYSLLVKQIHDNWENLKYITENDRSIIKPHKHIDGRMLVMNYEDIFSKIEADLKSSFGKRFRVNSDIANCFHSIYSHSIPWAIIGFDVAKNNMTSGNTHWSDDLDIFIRKTKRNETQGIAIGPGTSSVIAEIVLSAVDKELDEEGFEFKRYIDDYVCF
ncbi:RNA-directed DNA polymerase, partial [Methylophaga muralis]|uniref:RNA-directed DNA polymerase n=1 Tax=Methylophaga muralis TaxID=291169 RepID=UPI00159EFEE3